MDNVITHICMIDNHPVKRLSAKKKSVYISGLRVFLQAVAEDDDRVRFLFNAWVNSISGGNDVDYGHFAKGFKNIKKAMRSENEWWDFMTVKKTFFFDCFYLLCFHHRQWIDKVYAALRPYCGGRIRRKVLDHIYQEFKSDTVADDADLDSALAMHYRTNKAMIQNRTKKVLVVANVSAGKSTLINAITGHRICKSANQACTQGLHYIYNKPLKDVIVCKTGRGYEIVKDSDETIACLYESVALNFNSLLAKDKVCFIDTPGVNNAQDDKHRKVTMNAILSNEYDLLVYVSNCGCFGTDDEHVLLKDIKRLTDKPLLFVLNQLDRFRPGEDSVRKMLDEYRTFLLEIGFKEPVIVPTSAYGALLMKLNEEKLDFYEKIDSEQLKSRFDTEYYDFPSYVTQRSASSGMQRTGIPVLEQTIINLI